MPRTVYCHCGRPLKSDVRREGLTLRCPVHGIQFRYVVTAEPPPPKSDPPKPEPGRQGP
jgi:hypothetical protein